MIKNNIEDTRAEDFLGKIVNVKIDRQLGSVHPEYPETIYSINYGYVPDTKSPDGEELDAYVLGVDIPLETFDGNCIAIIKRVEDDDDKLIVVSEGVTFSEEEIRSAVDFQEKFFESKIIFYGQPS